MTSILRPRIAGVAVAALVWTACPAFAGQLPPSELTVAAGRPLRVVIARRTRIVRVGQPLTATLVEDVYSYDQVAIPEGTTVLGHVASLAGVPGRTRAAAMVGGDLTPSRLVGIQFDTLVLADGTRKAIQTVVTPGIGPSTLEVAGAHDESVAGRARHRVAIEVARAKGAIERPGKLSRFGHYLLARLPVHLQYFDAGAAFNAQLVEPVVLGPVARAAQAPDGAQPTPGSILTARLRTALDSTSTPRGTRVEAVLTQPLFSSSHELVFPEGTVVSGKVTFTKPAKAFRRNGQLRFLFESVEVPGRRAEALAAALYSADVGRDQRLVIDDEGGATVTNSKVRFLAPAVAGAVAVVGVDSTEISNEGLGVLTTQASVVGRGLKGFAGFGLIGVGVSLAYRPVAIALGVFGVTRAVYVNLLGKGRDVIFPVDTPVQMQLSPGTPPTP